MVQEFEHDMSSDVTMTDSSHISTLLSGMVEKLKVLKRKVNFYLFQPFMIKF